MDSYMNMFADDAKVLREVKNEEERIKLMDPECIPKLVWYMADEIQLKHM